MWNKIKNFIKKSGAWCKKNVVFVAAFVASIVAFLAGRCSNGSSKDFDKLRADNAKLVDQVNNLRNEYTELVKLNELNESQLNILRNQLELAENIARQSAEIDSGNSDDIGKLEQTNSELANWIRQYGNLLKGK